MRGFRVKGQGPRAKGIGPRVEGIGSRAKGLGARIWGLGARMLVGWIFALAMTAVAAPNEKPVRVDFTSQPESANVIVDGNMCGTTPLTLFTIAPGMHHVRFELKNYEPHDDFFTLQEGGYLVRNATLEPVKGLLLITTEPEGCAVSLDGLSFGDTPRLITNLDAKGIYRFTLQKAGYQSKNLEVKFDGRTPLVKHEKLILNSGMLTVKSQPNGASVTVNGISRGVTPLSISDIPKGRAVLEISKEGYVPQTRELTLNAGDSQNIEVALEGKPGSLFLSSVPDGARFYVNDQAHGKGPLTIQPLKPGTYSVRAEMDGRGSVTKNVTIDLGQAVREEFRLESVLGRLEVRTVPSGAKLLIDGHIIGQTKSVSSDSDTSAVFAIENLEAGEHALTVRKDGFAEVVKHPVIENLRTTSVTVKLRKVFKPNFRIITSTGTYEGYISPEGNMGDSLMVETSLGVTRPFPKSDIKELIPLSSD